ncbi:MAG TPA: RNA polymerase subunit sigma-70, partial [Chloroflexota bacterium]
PGHLRFVPTRANNGPALGIYGGGPSGLALWPTVLSVLQVDRGGIASVTSFMYPHLFPFFDLPPRLDGE